MHSQEEEKKDNKDHFTLNMSSVETSGVNPDYLAIRSAERTLQGQSVASREDINEEAT